MPRPSNSAPRVCWQNNTNRPTNTIIYTTPKAIIIVYHFFLFPWKSILCPLQFDSVVLYQLSFLFHISLLLHTPACRCGIVINLYHISNMLSVQCLCVWIICLCLGNGLCRVHAACNTHTVWWVIVSCYLSCKWVSSCFFVSNCSSSIFTAPLNELHLSERDWTMYQRCQLVHTTITHSTTLPFFQTQVSSTRLLIFLNQCLQLLEMSSFFPQTQEAGTFLAALGWSQLTSAALHVKTKEKHTYIIYSFVASFPDPASILALAGLKKNWTNSGN